MWKGSLGLTRRVAIVSSIGKVDLLGSNAEDAAIVDQWVHYAEHEILGPTSNIAGLVYGVYTPFNREVSSRPLSNGDKRV